MSIDPYRYPQRPANVDENIIKPTVQFRKEVFRVIKSIVGFILTYFVLVTARMISTTNPVRAEKNAVYPP